MLIFFVGRVAKAGNRGRSQQRQTSQQRSKTDATADDADGGDDADDADGGDDADEDDGEDEADDADGDDYDDDAVDDSHVQRLRRRLRRRRPPGVAPRELAVLPDG